MGVVVRVRDMDRVGLRVRVRVRAMRLEGIPELGGYIAHFLL